MQLLGFILQILPNSLHINPVPMLISKCKPLLDHSPMLLPDNIPRGPGVADLLFRLVRVTHL